MRAVENYFVQQLLHAFRIRLLIRTGLAAGSEQSQIWLLQRLYRRALNTFVVNIIEKLGQISFPVFKRFIIPEVLKGSFNDFMELCWAFLESVQITLQQRRRGECHYCEMAAILFTRLNTLLQTGIEIIRLERVDSFLDQGSKRLRREFDKLRATRQLFRQGRSRRQISSIDLRERFAVYSFLRQKSAKPLARN